MDSPAFSSINPGHSINPKAIPPRNYRKGLNVGRAANAALVLAVVKAALAARKGKTKAAAPDERAAVKRCPFW